MKTKFYFLAALATAMFASCANDEFVGDTSPTAQEQTAGDGSIQFTYNLPNRTRAGEFVGATAAEKLGGMFVVEGTKGTEKAKHPSDSVVFDNYLVAYNYNSAGTTKSNTNNWEYVGLESGITSPLRMSAATWSALHTGAGTAQAQTIKYWDYTSTQYDFIAWSTGTCEAIPVAVGAPADGKIEVSRIASGDALESAGFTMEAARAADLLQCYYTDIQTVTKKSGGYGQPVTLTFRNMAAKVRVALYETVPGYSVSEVKFYSSDANPTAPTDLGTGTSTTATLFTMGSDVLPQSGTVTVLYPRMGTDNHGAADYNKASVSVAPGSSTSKTQAFGTLEAQYRDETGNEPDGKYLHTTLSEATFAGNATESFYTAVIPNTNGKPLTLRVDYTLVSTDGSNEIIKVYGAKAVVPATYTVWLPNYAYTYIFKISDNSNGWTSTVNTDPKGLFPITFDAMVTSFTDANAEQTTVTTVATPSITTYQQGHDWKNKDEYSNSQIAGASSDKKDLYVQVMNNSGATPALITDLNTAGKSLLFKVSTNASEAEVMDVLENRTNAPTGSPKAAYQADDPVGRNGITLTKDALHISNTVTKIVNGVDDQPITVSSGQVAEIDIDQLSTGTYAYVYCTPPTSEEKVYHVAAPTTDDEAKNYYEINPTSLTLTSDGSATAGKVYFIENLDAEGKSWSPKSYTFKQTKLGDSVTGLFEATIPADKASSYTPGNFYFDVYYQNNGAYAVKVFKVVE